MPLYRVHFKWKNKEIQLTAKDLDLTHPYFVSIKNLVFTEGNRLIINPSQEDIKSDFSRSDHLMIPFQSVILIEELREEHRGRVMRFNLVDDDDDAGPADDGPPDSDEGESK